ncbi:MAG: hypothetical protein JOZ08_12820 [Verrucomicrobia bacterium]|nr:hypothetical protein [Verrucomicrobiota bacterium]
MASAEQQKHWAVRPVETMVKRWVILKIYRGSITIAGNVTVTDPDTCNQV